MWLWWIVSLVILAASIVFSLYIFYSSYKGTPANKDFPFRNQHNIIRKSFPFTKQQVISSLKLKLQAVENNSMLYYNELKKLQQRIQALEKNKGSGLKNDKRGYEEDENWEELYYEVSEQKEKMESGLDLTTQKLEEAESLIKELMRKETAWKEKRSEMENELNKAHSLQNKIGDLQRQLEGAAGREKELQQQLQTQQELYKDYELIQQQYSLVQSEADELRNRIKEITNRDLLLQQKINRLTELESTIEISEYEKMDIRKSIEEIITENEALAAKLQELQEKLNTEKYV
jgi:chromosome segregation ATPase